VSINYLKRSDQSQMLETFEQQMQSDLEEISTITTQRQIGFSGSRVRPAAS